MLHIKYELREISLENIIFFSSVVCKEAVNDVANAITAHERTALFYEKEERERKKCRAHQSQIEQMMQFDLNEMVDFSFQMARFDCSLELASNDASLI